MHKYPTEDAPSTQLRWQEVKSAIENLLPQENKQRLEQLPDESQYKYLTLIFHPEKVQSVRPDLLTSSDRIFKSLNLAYSTKP